MSSVPQTPPVTSAPQVPSQRPQSAQVPSRQQQPTSTQPLTPQQQQQYQQYQQQLRHQQKPITSSGNPTGRTLAPPRSNSSLAPSPVPAAGASSRVPVQTGAPIRGPALSSAAPTNPAPAVLTKATAPTTTTSTSTPAPVQTKVPSTSSQPPSGPAPTAPKSTAPVSNTSVVTSSVPDSSTVKNEVPKGVSAATPGAVAAATVGATGKPSKPTPAVAAKTPGAVTTKPKSKKPVAESPEDHKGEKLRKKADPPSQLNKQLWLVGHVLTLTFSGIYGLYYAQFKSQSSIIPAIAYRLAFVGVWLSYVIQILSLYDKKSVPSFGALMSTANFQYLLLSIVWFFNRSSIFKILPYYLISLLQLAAHFNIKPILKLSKPIQKVIVYNELVLFVVLIFDTLLFRGNSGFGLVAYGMFYWLKVLESENTRALVFNLITKLDGVLSKQKNPKVVEGWKHVKAFLVAKQTKMEHQYLS
ncbi:unnamed protein product [Ambrosiozyma monospora]|uniref:Unnamed protein product n=1 Tax=Ambrosiozyma monospora TaxID=43982 RepID=A0ACB5T1D0_AMBMO|nr:unnamed protein product [Ambrosiozyma monospora]